MQHELVTISCSFLRNFLTRMKLCNFKPDLRLMSSPITFTESVFVNTNHRCCQPVLFIFHDPIALDNVMFETEKLFSIVSRTELLLPNLLARGNASSNKNVDFRCYPTGQRKEEYRKNGELQRVQRNLNSIESCHLLLWSSFRFGTGRCRQCRIQSRYHR